ncbi:MAG: 2-oxoisovalerate dehydrogenase E2 component (dihydrolipoyl transacylase) [Motiliproteus sp.]|jgi:2-oxoisovalerate dehydrogenase E2 component (dihydrolipoyl transacylase)
MIKDFILPDIGEGIVECELVEWLISEGDRLEEDQPVADVMTDKALVQIPAPHAGIVTRLYYQQGEIARVHSPLFAVDLDEEEGAGAAESSASVAETTEATKTTEAPETVVAAVSSAGTASASVPAATIDFILPDIGEGIVECEVVEWLIKEGDRLEEDQPVVDVMTDKALVQIPAPRAGVVTRLYFAQGEIAKVHGPLFALLPDEEAAMPATVQPAAVAAVVAPAVAPAAAVPSKADPSVSVTRVKGSRPGKALASPAVRRIAREFDLDISQVPGSGKHGRVFKEDIVHFQQQAEQAVAVPVAGSPVMPAEIAVVAPAPAGIRVEKIRGIKAAMARQMTLSASTIPHFTYGDEVDVTALLALRAQLKIKAEKQGIRLTLMPFIMKALALAIQEFPILNSQVNADCTEIHYQPHCNIGMAVDSKLGLMVPNIKKVETLSILEIAQEVTRLAEAARSGRVSPADLQGGTISISNIGALGGTYASPVVNPPEVAIVALGKTQTLPRFNAQGEVVARSLLNISWSGDHRIIDGGTIARFSLLWQSYLEDPSSMLLDLS